MGRKVKIYYGISGSLKGTTIKEKEKCSQIMWSKIKPWKNYRSELFPWISEETNINYALLHLTRLEDYPIGNLVVERGVSDMLFFENLRTPGLITSSTIESAVQKELSLIGGESEKILVIMEDHEFITTKTLSEPTRREWFGTLDCYLDNQRRYVEFTKTYNKIDQEVVIKNARDYISSELGIEFIV